MAKKIPFILFLMLSISLVAQTTKTVTIDWDFGSNPNATGAANASRTIEIGDTVTWLWLSNNHNVVSKNSANESFNSGAIDNIGTTFSHTFISIGTSEYVCSPHPASMFGTITVVAEATLSIGSFDALGTIKMYPNPTDSNITIDFQIQNIEKLNVKVFNLLGKELLAKQISKKDTTLMVSELKNGIYFIRITSLDGENSTTKRFVKI